MSRLDKGVRAAIEAARRSNFHSHKVGAAIFIGPRLVSLDCNNHKSHPKNPAAWSRHAEFNSLIRLVGQNLSRAVLFVARLTRTEKVSCARPCPLCQELIIRLGIKRVFYTNYQGELELLKLSA